MRPRVIVSNVASMDPRPPGLLEGSGSLLNPLGAPLQEAEPDPTPEGEHLLPDHVVGVPGRR